MKCKCGRTMKHINICSRFNLGYEKERRYYCPKCLKTRSECDCERDKYMIEEMGKSDWNPYK